jgi:hypothetical protein
MKPWAREPRRPPYWLLPVFALLLLSPTVWVAGALVAAAIGVTAARAVIGARARRASDVAAGGVGGVGAGGGLEAAVALGVDRDGRAVLLSEHQLSAHGLILGASGSGKTTTMAAILTDHIRRGKAVIAIDLKGSPAFAAELAAAASDAGRELRIWTPDGPTHWNPLQHGNATELKDKLIATERFTEPHYKRAAERYAQNALRVLQELAPDRPPTLQRLVETMDPAVLGTALRAVSTPLADQVQDYLAGLTPDQHSAIRGLGTRLAVITESHTGPYLSPPGGTSAIDLRRAIDQSEVVLFSLNSSTYGGLAAQIGTLVVQDLITTSGHRTGARGVDGTPEQALVAIDEFSALDAAQVAALFERAREARMTVLLATQELADLEHAGPGVSDQILGNAAVVIAHRQDVPKSARLIAEMVGTEERWDYSYQVGQGMFSRLERARTTKRLTERFVIHPNEIKSLGTGEAVLITKLPEASARIIKVTPGRRVVDQAASLPGVWGRRTAGPESSAAMASDRSAPGTDRDSRASDRSPRDPSAQRHGRSGGPERGGGAGL